ncbi:MAG: aminotransferase class V-fold PLP-dependent enzyme [Hyphomicrobiales bacterium]|nr:aminotransferase class V-fold PLP-dependent enzyme [Hyphomicrobiales bacterium]
MAKHTDEIRALLADAAERGMRYLAGVAERRVYPEARSIERLEDILKAPFPDRPTEASKVILLIDEFGSPATVASAGGRYFGFVTGGALPATVAANWLAGAWDQNSFSFVSSPAAALFEEAALRWLKQALRLPAGAEGALVAGATMANFTCLAAARHEVLMRAGWDVERQGLFAAPEVTVIVGEEVHASVVKVLAMLGLGRERLTRVPVDGQGRMRPEAMPEIAGPTILCLQAGNVNSGAFDPAATIIPRARAKGAWVHVDGAFGLWARACPGLAALAEGFEAVDSWATDAHKWLNVPYDCGVALVREPEPLRRAMSVSGAYIAPSGRRDAIDVTPDSSRRARAVEVWAALKSLGRSGLAEMIERNCRQARWLAGELSKAGIEVLNDVVLNQIVVSFGDDDRTTRAISALQRSGEIWCGGTTWRGRAGMRVSVSSWATRQADMERALKAILAAGRQ